MRDVTILLLLVYCAPRSAEPTPITLPCDVDVPRTDPTGAIAAVKQAHRWNDLLPPGLRAIDHHYYSTEEVFHMVNERADLIVCVAREVDIPPELLAGTLALELDLDYHLTDRVVDSLIRTNSRIGEILSGAAIGGGYGGVHTSQLRPAVLGSDFAETQFTRAYAAELKHRDDAAYTRLTTSSTLIDLTNTAIMSRHYLRLRLGNRPIHSATLIDLAFTWTAYRGGVIGTHVDTRPDHRWSLSYLQRANDPYQFGEAIIALPYFSYYREMVSGM
jgi:hypothetical protein